MIPMLANPLEIGLAKHDSQWARAINEGYTMEPKLDGMRLLLSFNESGRLHAAYTRSGRDVSYQVPVAWKAQCPQMPAWTVLDCEFGYLVDNTADIFDFNKTMRVMGSGAEVAQFKASEIPALPTAYVFDVLMAKDSWVCDKSQKWRRLLLETITPRTFDHLRLADSRPCWNFDQYTEYVNRGGEGMILKNPHAPYIKGKRPTQTWYKVKAFTTIDVVITGFQEGQGKYQGQIGAIKFGVYTNDGILQDIGQCSGMTDDLRAQMTVAAGAMIGKVMEIRYFGLTAGTPRHPQFVRMREDKSHTECTIDQIC